MSNNTLEQDLVVVGNKLLSLAKAQGKTMRQIATDTDLSVNSVKVVFSGTPGNLKTYDAVARYLGTSFVDVVVGCFQSGTGSGMGGGTLPDKVDTPSPVAKSTATQPV